MSENMMIENKIEQLPDGVNVWTNICDPKDGKWKTNVQAFDSSDLKNLLSELRCIRKELAEAEKTLAREREFICKKCGLRQELGEKTEPSF